MGLQVLSSSSPYLLDGETEVQRICDQLRKPQACRSRLPAQRPLLKYRLLWPQGIPAWCMVNFIQSTLG